MLHRTVLYLNALMRIIALAIFYLFGFIGNAQANEPSKDSIRTMLSLEYGELKGISEYDITQLKPTHASLETYWRCYGLRLHQELNQYFQINTGVLMNSIDSKKIPQMSYSFPVKRSIAIPKIQFIQVPIGLNTMINMYKRKLYLGLYFSINLNYLRKDFREFAIDYSEFQNMRFVEQRYFVNSKFYASQELGFNINYFLSKRFRVQLAYYLTIENNNPIIASDREETIITQSSTNVFDGTGTKINFQIGYTLFKNKSFLETKQEADSTIHEIFNAN